ncbi:MAG: protein translocase subunit SecF [Myxococcales bacterium]|nr:MAG: protein translocase subunit SecF [Myxococcales bacterium]
MQWINPDINLPFVPNAKMFFGISAVVVVASWVVILIFGFNYGIDFAGGTEIQAKFNEEVDVGRIRSAVNGLTGISSEVQRFGAASENEFLIKLANITYVTTEREVKIQAGLQAAFGDKGFRRFHHASAGGDKVEFTLDTSEDMEKVKKIFADADSATNEITVTGSEGRFIYRAVLEGLGPHISQALEKEFGPNSFEILRLDSVGPKVGAELQEQGLLALFYSMLGILIYVAFRFDYRFSPGAIVALVHDVSITAGVFAILQLEFTIPTIAALLTIIGYSVNDTIVVYDRIRENLAKAKVKPLEVVVNESINQTLSRTILTSGTTMLVVIALLIFGGGILFDFAFALLIGIGVGTYSSIFIASPIMIWLYRWIEKRGGATSPVKA